MVSYSNFDETILNEESKKILGIDDKIPKTEPKLKKQMLKSQKL
jgi:hypothetical protein